MRKKEVLFEFATDLFFALLLYLFYKSVFALLLVIPAAYGFHRCYKKVRAEKYSETLNVQFKDALLSFAASLRVGFSMENALTESIEEMRQMYGEAAPITQELTRVCGQLSVGVPLETAFLELANKSGAAEIQTFATVFQIAKRTGGDLVEIMKKTASDIAAKIDTKGEIAVIVRGKKLEQNLMALAPPLMILYVDFSAGSLLEPLYETLLGRVVMTVCLGLYIGAYFISRRILKIEV